MLCASHYLDEANPRLHYLSYGAGQLDPARPSLIFLHGATSHAHYWDHLAPDFVADYNVYALDWRGHGDSTPAEEYSQLDGYLSDLRRMIERLDPARLYLVGHSLGGYVQLAYAATAGDPRLMKMVVVDMATGLSEGATAFMKQAATRPAQKFSSLDNLAAKFHAILRDSTANKALLDYLAHQGARQGPDGSYSFKYDRRALAFPVPDPYRFAAEVQIPTLVINGQLSELVTANQADGVSKALQRGKHLEIVGAGHHVFLDRPHEFSRAVYDFLQN